MNPADRESLKDQLRATVAGRADGIDLDTPEHWIISEIYEKQAPQFFESIEQLLSPGSVLYFEGTSIAPDISAFYLQHRAPNTVSVVRDTIHPVPETFHVTLSPEVISRLRELSQTRPLAELCDHVKAYQGQTLLFTFHDAFTGILRISQHVPESKIKAFCDAFGIEYSVEQTHKRNPGDLQAFLNLLQDPNAIRKIRFVGEPRWRTWWRRLTGR
jgi:hypothetical protein